MEQEQRLVYRELTEVMGASLCTACKYSSWTNDGCCAGYNECQHPIEALSWESKNEEMLEPGWDCYGFKPDISVSLLADLAGTILSLGRADWTYRRYSKESLTVYWQGYADKRDESGKVRIG